MDMLRDPIWQFAGALLGLAAIGVSIYLYFLQKNRKFLVYQIMIEENILTMKEGFENKIQIYFEGKQVHKVHLLLLKILNNGNVPIACSDFESPLVIAFKSPETSILDGAITETRPPKLKPIVTFESNQIIIQPMLLNSGDSIIIKALLLDYSEVELHTHVLGVNEIRKVADPETWWSRSVITGMLVSFGLLVVLPMALGSITATIAPQLVGEVCIGTELIGFIIYMVLFMRIMREREKQKEQISRHKV